MTWVLAIDTSAAETSLCLASLEGSIHTKRVQDPDSHSEKISFSVQVLLKEAGIATSDLRGILVGSGPGSFTGLRIGYSFVKGLALSREIPVVAISSLEAAAWEFCRKFRGLVVTRDARREEVFFQVFLCTASGLPGSIHDAAIAPISEISARVSKLKSDYGLSDKEIGYVSSDPSGDVCAESLRPTSSSRGLLEIWRTGRRCQLPAFDLTQLMALEPVYMRSVAAKTIAERLGPGSRPGQA